MLNEKFKANLVCYHLSYILTLSCHAMFARPAPILELFMFISLIISLVSSQYPFHDF